MQQLGERVIVHGAVSQTDLAYIIKQSHIFVLPSFMKVCSLWCWKVCPAAAESLSLACQG
jgi:glycosyltransferase involved in cell wall biosynthesis